MTETLQEGLRRKLKERLGMNLNPPGTYRDGAEVMGIKMGALYRFLKGESTSGRMLDAVSSFLGESK